MIRYEGNVHIARHPLHPILVLIPVGLWIGSFVFDIVFLSTGAPFWFRAAYWNMLFGVIGALVATIAGFVDLFSLRMSDQAKKTGLTHMTLNLIIVALYIVNVAVRYNMVPTVTAEATTPFILNLVSVILLLISGWLGGELIYRHGVAVPEEAADEALRFPTPQVGRPGIAGARGGGAEFPPEDRHDR